MTAKLHFCNSKL